MRITPISIAILALSLASCQESSRSQIPQKIVVERETLPLSSCSLPNSFASVVTRVVARDKNYYFGLLHFQKTLESLVESVLFSCDLASGNFDSMLTGDEKSQIIDFALTSDGEVYALKSNSSNLKKEETDLSPDFYRELEIYNVSTKKSLGLFFDPTFNDGLIYNSSGLASPVHAIDQNRTFLHSTVSTMAIARIYLDRDSLFVSYVGNGGYRLARLEKKNGKLSEVKEIMPNTEANNILFARNPAEAFVQGDFIYTVSPIYSEDVIAYNRHFNRNLGGFPSSNYSQLLVEKWSKNLEFIDQIIVTDQAYLYRGYIVEKNNQVLVAASNASKVKVFLVDFSTQTVQALALPVKEKASIWDVQFCGDFLWAAGVANYEQVSTGSIVGYGDSFLSKLDLASGQAKVKYYGTDRKDSIESLSCFENSLFVGGLQNGPITHTGDKDPKLRFQNAISGRLDESI